MECNITVQIFIPVKNDSGLIGLLDPIAFPMAAAETESWLCRAARLAPECQGPAEPEAPCANGFLYSLHCQNKCMSLKAEINNIP